MITRIKELRQEKKLTQGILAGKLGFSQTVVSRIERGICEPDASTIIRLSGYFHVSADYLLQLSPHRLPVSDLLGNNPNCVPKLQHQILLIQHLSSNQLLYLDHFLEASAISADVSVNLYERSAFYKQFSC